MSAFKMAPIQMNSAIKEVEKNLAKAEEKIREAASNGAQFICLPEAFNTGYYFKMIREMADLAESIDGKTISRMRALAKELNVFIVSPFIQDAGGSGEVKNTAVLIGDDGQIIGTHNKTHPVGDEAKYFRRGTEYVVYKTKYGNIDMLVCYDLCFPETSRILALKGSDIIIIPVACRDSPFFRSWLYNNCAARGVDNVCYIAAACMVGNELPESPFTGGSQFISPHGTILAEASNSDEEILYQDIDFSSLPEYRKENTVLTDRHPEDYLVLCEK